MRDQSKDHGEKLDEVNMAARGEEPRPIFISTNLSKEMREQVIQLLKEFKDVLAWMYAQMLGLDSQLVSHKLNIKERCKPVKQALRIRLELEVQIKEEIQKLLDVGFIKPVRHPRWWPTLFQ